MPNPSITTTAAGDVSQDILLLLTTDNEAVSKGSVQIIDGVQNKISIGRVTSSANIIQPRQAEPTNPSNATAYTEKLITPLDMMVYDQFNPRVFEAVWREFQPQGPLVDRVLDPNVQRVLVEAMSRQIGVQVGNLIWQGDTTLATGNALSYFNGFITLASASSTNIDVANIGAITTGNVISILDSIDSAIPDALYDDPNMIIHMNTGDFRKYQQAVRALTYKGQGPADSVPAIYNGREIRYYHGLPANSILVAKASTGADSNLKAAVDMVNDVENLKIERFRPESELFFIKALFKMAVSFGFDEEVVLYQGSGS